MSVKMPAYKWRPDRDDTVPSWHNALRQLDDKFGRNAVAKRLGVSTDIVREWLQHKSNAMPAYQKAILEWWGRDETADMDDAVIYVVQALRMIGEKSTMGDTVSIAGLVARMDEINRLAEKTLGYLKQRINAPTGR